MRTHLRKIILPFFWIAFFVSGCIEEPVKEDVPELITKVKLIFTSTTGGGIIEATATDPDGEGIQDLKTDGVIVLPKGHSYSLSISLLNELADITSPEYNITDEVQEEGSEHMIFFSWTDGLFASPTGNGNVDNRQDAVNYEDADSNGFPIGLTTNWTALANPVTGTFRIILKHQPELKSPTSGVDIGETDLDVTFDIEVQ